MKPAASRRVKPWMLGTMPESATDHDHHAGSAQLSDTPLEPVAASSPAREGRVLCPYCGCIQRGGERCERCKGLFEPLSRQATQNMMGPWQVRDESQPFLPGVSHERIRDLVARGRISRGTVLRGPTTRQFWALACNTQGVAVLLGECHTCHAPVAVDGFMCKSCGCVLTAPVDRQSLGLGPVRALPGEVSGDVRPPSQPLAARPDGPIVQSNFGSLPAPANVALPTDVPGEIAAYTPHRRAARGENKAFVPVMVAMGVLIVLVLWALTARRTPLDAAIEGFIESKPSQSHPAPVAR